MSPGSRAKRAFDVVVAGCGLLVLSPVIAAGAIAVLLTSGRPAFFRQERVGLGFETFEILKLRTMRPASGPAVTVGHDERITAVGSWLRRTKVDELPQLWNVVRGQMSLVGPRPELPHYVEQFRDDYAVILTVRPGITDEASLTYRREAEVLATAPDPNAEYVERVLPHKIEIARRYVEQRSLLGDLSILVRTVTGRS